MVIHTRVGVPRPIWSDSLYGYKKKLTTQVSSYTNGYMSFYFCCILLRTHTTINKVNYIL